jgi:hypothetical protein
MRLSFVVVAMVVGPVFAAGAGSTGWVRFEFQDQRRIFVPAKVNGRDATVELATGFPVADIDKGFAGSLGVAPAGRDSLVRGLRLEIGALTLDSVAAAPVDFAASAARIGHPLPMIVGSDLLEHLIVDIDFAHQRIAFRDPARGFAKPDGAIELPVRMVDGYPVVPVSMEGAAPGEFEIGLGNSGEALIYPSYYRAHHLMDGRPTSVRLAGGTGGFSAETVATVRSVRLAGVSMGAMPVALIPARLAADVPAGIAGDIGIPLLSRFRLILDVPHGRMYALPYDQAARAPFAKERLGLALAAAGDGRGLVVGLVAPHGPGETAGFAVGDTVVAIDGRGAAGWSPSAVLGLRYGKAGTVVVFTTSTGARRRVVLADYY